MRKLVQSSYHNKIIWLAVLILGFLAIASNRQLSASSSSAGANDRPGQVATLDEAVNSGLGLDLPVNPQSVGTTMQTDLNVTIPQQSDWVDHGEIFAAGELGEWDYYLWGGFTGTAVRRNGTTYLYYQGAREYVDAPDYTVIWRSIGVATSPDGINFTKYSGNPVVEWYPSGYPDGYGEEGAASGGVTLDNNGDIALYYGANTAISSTSVHADGRLAISTDGFNFTDVGAVMPYDDSTYWGWGDELFPIAAIQDTNRWIVYYLPNGSGVGRNLGVAWGDARDNLTNSAAARSGASNVAAWGMAGKAKVGPDTYAIFTNYVSDSRTEVRLMSLDAPNILSDPVEIYQFPEVNQATVLLDEESNTWFMYYRSNGYYGVKTAPAGLPPTATPEPTDTAVPPTATPEPTDTAVPPTATSEPTDTAVPPTATPEPTETAVPPTATDVPPTATPVTPTATPEPSPTPANYFPLVTGVIDDLSSEAWTIVNLPRDFGSSMVVVASPNYSLNQPPVAVRIRNAAGNHFEASLQRLDGGEEPVSGVKVHYLAVEAGKYEEQDYGIKMEAVKFTSTTTSSSGNWKAERIKIDKYDFPVVLGQVMTSNSEDFSLFYAHGIHSDDPPYSRKVNVGKHVGEDPEPIREDETIGYIVLESGSGMIGTQPYIAGVTEDIVTGFDDNPPILHDLSGVGPFSVAIVSSAGMDDNNGGWPVLYGADPLADDTLQLAIDEDQLSDSERQHATEQVAYIVFK